MSVKKATRNVTTIIVDSLREPEVSDIANDCMAMLGPGIYYHFRLGMIIVVREMLPSGVAQTV